MTSPSGVAWASSAGGAGLAPSHDSAGFHEPSTVIASYSSPTTTSTSTGQRGGQPSGAETRSVDPTFTSNRRRARSIGAVVITRRDAERVGAVAGYARQRTARASADERRASVADITWVR